DVTEQALPDGTQTMILSIAILPIVDDSGMCTHLLWSGHDVTEQKKAEAQLRVSLQEKEILLKEIHHRVKNNLQVISSLLYLQSQKIKDERFIDLFRESQNRVAAMALVHEQLYQSNNFAEVNFGRYIRTLASSLFDSYGVDSSQIALGIHTDGSTLDVHTAIPCGLLLSEILSNALKYAFPEARRGRITINFYEEENMCHLWVADDGIGMPAPSHIRAGSLGLQLIDRLVAQIGGTMERNGTPGTSYHIWRATTASV
ncbi:MAG TPA: histidine kinase dimerization/phosphoacceptor domain -containing protein, partial [Anaerolineales bacterium]|nr:histidine kinase dimerization/phosphoacceptor domain -containing protein [Anaerolineales bacterium]